MFSIEESKKETYSPIKENTKERLIPYDTINLVILLINFRASLSNHLRKGRKFYPHSNDHQID